MVITLYREIADIIKHGLVKGAMLRRFCCFGSIICWNRHLVVLLMHKMFLIKCEVNI